MKLCTILVATALATAVFAHPDDFSKPYELVTEDDDVNVTCKYASRSHIYNVFSNAQKPGFYYNFDEQIDWDIMFTHPLSGHYSNLTEFLYNGILRLSNVFQGEYSGGLKLQLANIIGGCNDPWSAQEILITGVLLNGAICDEVVVWNTRWDQRPKVVQARTYVDSRFTTDAIVNNEVSTNSTWRTIRTDFIPGQYGFMNFTNIVDSTDYHSAMTNYSYTVTTTSFTNLNLPSSTVSTSTTAG